MTPVAVISKQYQTPAGIQIKTCSRHILVVAKSRISPAAEVRERFKRVKPLKDISVKERGWTLDVLNGIRRLGKVEFTNGDAYTLAEHLERLHPDNRHE
jgi:hypothetical protein